jgi:hypothetical protein
MLINAQQPRKSASRSSDGVLEELYVERQRRVTSTTSTRAASSTSAEHSGGVRGLRRHRNGFCISDVSRPTRHLLDPRREGDRDRGERGERRGGRRDSERGERGEGRGDRRRRDEPERGRPSRGRDEGRRRREQPEPIAEESREEVIGFEEVTFQPEPAEPREEAIREESAELPLIEESFEPPLIAEEPLVEPGLPRERRRSRGGSGGVASGEPAWRNPR